VLHAISQECQYVSLKRLFQVVGMHRLYMRITVAVGFHLPGEFVFSPATGVHQNHFTPWAGMLLDKICDQFDVFVFIEQVATNNNVKKAQAPRFIYPVDAPVVNGFFVVKPCVTLQKKPAAGW